MYLGSSVPTSVFGINCAGLSEVQSIGGQYSDMLHEYSQTSTECAAIIIVKHETHVALEPWTDAFPVYSYVYLSVYPERTQEHLQ